MPSDTLRPKLQTSMTTGGPGPDVVYEGLVHTQRYASYPYGYIPLTKFIGDAGLKSKIPESFWAPALYKDDIYALPFNAITWYIAYNNDDYAAAGISGPARTWDELHDTVKKTTVPEKDQYGFSNQTDKFVIWLLETFWYQSGVGWFEGSEDFLKYDLTKPLAFNSGKGIAALEYLRSLVEFAPGGPKGTIGVSNDALVTQMAQGHVATMYHLMLYINQVPQQNPALVGGKNLRLALAPKGPLRGGGALASSGLGITRGSKSPDAAWQLVKYLSDKGEASIATSIGGFPIRTDAELPPAARDNWLLQPARDALQQGFQQGFFPQWDGFREVIGKQVQAYYLDQKTAAQALNDAAEQCRQILKG